MLPSLKALTISLAFLAASTCAAIAQAQVAAPDTRSFIAAARKALKWDEPLEPFKVAGPIYFVGTHGLGAWLFATRDGLLLLNTAMPGSGPMIADSIRKLGFKPEDIKIIASGHAHLDHVGGHAYMKALSGAQVVAMDGDVAVMESGGKDDFFYRHELDIMGFDPVKVDRVLHDGDTVTLGEVTLTARKTAGHTKGTTTFVASISDDGKEYTVVFPDGVSVNPGYKLMASPSYDGIADDYRRTLQTLEALVPDIWLTAHTEWFDIDGKRARAQKDGVAAWVDPDGYRAFIAKRRKLFEQRLELESGSK